MLPDASSIDTLSCVLPDASKFDTSFMPQLRQVCRRALQSCMRHWGWMLFWVKRVDWNHQHSAMAADANHARGHETDPENIQKQLRMRS